MMGCMRVCASEYACMRERERDGVMLCVCVYVCVYVRVIYKKGYKKNNGVLIGNQLTSIIIIIIIILHYQMKLQHSSKQPRHTHLTQCRLSCVYERHCHTK